MPAMAFPATSPLREAARLRRERHRLADGARTTVYAACFDLDAVEVRVAILRGQQRLAEWCAARGHGDAIVGGFFTRPDGRPLGEVRTRGVVRDFAPFDAPWDRNRACVHVRAGRPLIARRDELPEQPRGDLLQAGPLLVREGRTVFCRREDAEGFSAGKAQFDSDITDGRYPRAALGLAGGRLWAVVCDGRSRHDCGLTLEELADYMRALGCESALNLDGGGSTTLVSGGRLVNRPRKDHEVPEVGGRPISTALIFAAR